MSKGSSWGLFDAYGIELEYMIVDRETLAVRPLADVLLRGKGKSFRQSVKRGPITWSNELALHVVELKCSMPTGDLVQLAADFHENVLEANAQLAEHGACLLGTAAHPWMNPDTETRLWPHGDREIYGMYDRLFDCRGHGWSNLQSVHINLPFRGQEEFARLHSAIRLVLPLIPAVAASSPILDGKYGGTVDQRLVYYQQNQRRVPQIIGPVIPEPVQSEAEYHKTIYAPIKEAITPLDPDGVLDSLWLNSRAAIARFDRNAIEIRVMDIQECPQADLALVALVSQTVRLLAEGKLAPLEEQVALTSNDLRAVFGVCIKDGHQASVAHHAYLKALGLGGVSASAETIWRHLLAKTQEHYPAMMEPWLPTLRTLLQRGTLASKLVEQLPAKESFTVEELRPLYQQLQTKLVENAVLL